MDIVVFGLTEKVQSVRNEFIIFSSEVGAPRDRMRRVALEKRHRAE